MYTYTVIERRMGISLDKLIHYEPNPKKLKNPFEKWRLINVNKTIPVRYRMNAKVAGKTNTVPCDTASKKLTGGKMRRSTNANGKNYHHSTHLVFGSSHFERRTSTHNPMIASAYVLPPPANITDIIANRNGSSNSVHLNGTLIQAHHQQHEHHYHHQHHRYNNDNAPEHNHRLGTIMLGKRFAHFAIPSALTFFAFTLVCGILLCIFEQRRRRLLLVTTRRNQRRQRKTPHTLDGDKDTAKIADAHVVPPVLIPLPSEPCKVDGEASGSQSGFLKLRKTLKKIIGYFVAIVQISKMYNANGDLKGKTLKMTNAFANENVKMTMTSRTISFSGRCSTDIGNLVNKEVEQGMTLEDIRMLDKKRNWHPDQQQHQGYISIV